MNFKIRLLDKNTKKRWDYWNVKGEIVINDFVEDLYPPIDYWNAQDYENQWREGINRLAKEDNSCLVVSINNPRCRKFVEWWLLYKINNKVYVRNSIIIEDIYEERIGDKPFTMQTCYDFIPERGASHDEDGNKISEWVFDWNGKVE